MMQLSEVKRTIFNLPRVVTSLSPGSLKKYFCDDCEVLFLQKYYFSYYINQCSIFGFNKKILKEHYFTFLKLKWQH